MAHEPIGPDGTVKPNMHGFDPLGKTEALTLIDGFSNIALTKSLDATQPSFYMDGNTLTELLQGERSENGLFDGLQVIFGIDSGNRMALLINRVSITENEKGIRRFAYVPQYAMIESRDNNGELFRELIEYALLTVNVDSSSQLHRLDIDGAAYQQLRVNFQNLFASENPLTTYKISARTMLTSLHLDPSHPFVFRQQFMVTGYYIGWGTLNLVRQETGVANSGIKLLLGYGPRTQNPDSAKCMHLIAIAATSPQADVLTYPNDKVWSTQDQSKPVQYVDKPLPFSPLETPLPNTNAGPNYFVGTLGSSCSDESTSTVP